MTQKTRILTEEEHLELKKHLKTEQRVKIWKRYKALSLDLNDFCRKDISKILDISERTIYNWILLFNEKGFEGLSTLDYDGRRESRLEPIKEDIELIIDEEIIPTLSCLKDTIKERFGIEIEQSWLSRWMKKKLNARIKNRV